MDASRCVGCGKCVAVAPEAFEIDPETGKAKIKDGASQEDIARGIRAAAEERGLELLP
ncbi:MAG: ferredoxin, partial [Armatimonadota bacterium]